MAEEVDDVRVVRVYHAGRDAGHRARDRALAQLGIQLTLVVPRHWPDPGAQEELTSEPFEVLELDVRRAGDVNRHTYRHSSELERILTARSPDVLDIHEEPVSAVARQWLHVAGERPVTMYTAQNIDKRFPPPFAQFEKAAYRRVDAMYPCSRQAAAVVRGKGFAGLLEVLPLGVDNVYRPGSQEIAAGEIRMGLVGRLVPEKGVLDALEVLTRLRGQRPVRLVIVGSGPEEDAARMAAKRLGVANAIEFVGWRSGAALAELYRTLHVLLVPSLSTETWVEQFGRIIIEAQASGVVVAGYSSGAIPEVGGDAMLLVDEGNKQALAASVERVLNDPSLYEKLRRSGIEQAGSMTWAQVARRQQRLYEQAVASPQRRLDLPRSGHVRREFAEHEFGPPAQLAGGVRRPFALPLLRRNSAVTNAAASAFDAGVRLLGR